MKLDNYRFIAHRGLYNRLDTPENSMKAFENAILKGYAIELDINMTKDGHLVVFHDSNLKRMTGIKNNVDEKIDLLIINAGIRRFNKIENMKKEEIIEYALSLPNTYEDYPFPEDNFSVTMKHKNTNKWFALIMKVQGKLYVNVKTDH